jgi:hypothetical protein
MKPGPRFGAQRTSGNIAIAMSAFTDFQRWVLSDWGRPNFLTSIGVPRIVTNFLGFLLGFVVLVDLQLRFVAPGDKEKVQVFLHNPFILTAYAALYVAILTREFLSSKYQVKGRTLDKFMRENWNEPFVKVSTIALASMFLLFVVGALVYRFQLK